MKLSHIQITEFQSISDSNEFEIGDITCLVGKNEAGKSAILKAIYRLNPIENSEGLYDVTHDYPRNTVEDYRYEVESETRPPAIVVKAQFALEESELQPIFDQFGRNCITSNKLILSKGYDHAKSGYSFTISANEGAALKHLFTNAKLESETQKNLLSKDNVASALGVLESLEETSEIERLKVLLESIKKIGFRRYIFDTYIDEFVPEFLYFDEYYQMTGLENIEALIQRKSSKTLKQSDHPILGLIELARLNLNELQNPDDTQALKNKLQGAGNYLSRQVLKYWSQNKHIQMQFDVRPGLAKDPVDMRDGMNIWAEVYDSRHRVSTNLGTRSRGFVWFFSFLAWYSQVKRQNKPLIILLDEPGLSLHGKAQEDLLRYFEAEIKGVHQLIYTTHSPFMVDSGHFERVRIVQDKGIDSTEPLKPTEEGTRVITSIEDANEDSLFPLQGALGYEIYQALFVGPNCLIVEGVSDLIYLQVMSGLLERTGRVGLDKRWTITPVGGSDKIPTFVALIGSQRGINIATLVDIQSKDRQKIENLYKKRLLKKNQVIIFSDFTGKSEADIEDAFEANFYLSIFNEEFKNDLSAKILLKSLDKKQDRIIVQINQYLKSNPLKDNIGFNHYRPARYLSENIASLGKKISDDTVNLFEDIFKKVNTLL